MPGAELYDKPWALFWLLQTLGVVCLLVGLAFKLRFYLQGTKPSLHQEPDYTMMLKAFWNDVIFQRQVAKRSVIRWLAHIFIFYGFLGLLFLSALSVGLKFVPHQLPFYQWLAIGSGHNYYKALGDIFGFMLLVGISIAGFRRYVTRDHQLATDSQDSLALGLLLALIITGFLLEAMRIALLPVTADLKFSLIGFPLAALFRGSTGISNALTVLWVIHAGINAVLMMYLPFSKFMHMFSSPAEIMLNASEERLRGDLYI